MAYIPHEFGNVDWTKQVLKYIVMLIVFFEKNAGTN